MRTLEQRVETLERELNALKQLIAQNTSGMEWRRTVGAFEDDPVFAEMVREGRKYRESERDSE